jgi:hypothetical protein
MKILFFVCCSIFSGALFADVEFHCDVEKITKIDREFDLYIGNLGIESELYTKNMTKNKIQISLTTHSEETNTLDFSQRPKFKITDDIVYLPVGKGLFKEVSTVSKKEILLAMLQHGRVTQFSGKMCDIKYLKQQIGVRQNIVAWAEKLAWVWPDGGPAFWNKKYWIRGTPVQSKKLTDAFNDMFFNQKKYSIGCYTASKIVYAHAILDYFNRVEKNSELALKVEKQLLMGDGEPLVGIEPGVMWKFEKDFPPEKEKNPGKILDIQFGVSAKNFIPGDWSYILNTDPKTYEKIGYEGSNAIYLGKNRFDDYYADRDQGHYKYEEKMFEVYQWRNGVFSASRHKHKVKPIPIDVQKKMDLTPENGGQVFDFRVFPKIF